MIHSYFLLHLTMHTHSSVPWVVRCQSINNHWRKKGISFLSVRYGTFNLNYAQIKAICHISEGGTQPFREENIIFPKTFTICLSIEINHSTYFFPSHIWFRRVRPHPKLIKINGRFISQCFGSEHCVKIQTALTLCPSLVLFKLSQNY